MIAYLEGNITHKAPTHTYIDIGGVAYDVQISLNTYAHVEDADKIKLFTHLVVREDSQTLFGFYSLEEKELFIKLLSVSGIGPNTARVILSYMNTEEVVRAISTDNVTAFKKVKGVGPKTAQRIILDLKDKIVKKELDKGTLTSLSQPSIREEAISALVALGFQKTQVSKQVDKVLTKETDITQVEVLIKETLRQFS